MTENANWELQQSIYQTLSSDTALSALLGGAKIYDYVPQRTRPPYITIGMSMEQDWSTSTENGREHIITLHSWTENRGQKQARQIITEIQKIMTQASLSMTGHNLINLVFEFNELRRDPDGETLHGLTRYRIKTEPK